jgi:hypothetical protein
MGYTISQGYKFAEPLPKIFHQIWKIVRLLCHRCSINTRFSLKHFLIASAVLHLLVTQVEICGTNAADFHPWNVQ